MKVSPDQLLSQNRAIQNSAIKRLYGYCVPRLAKMMRGHTLKETEPVDIFQDGMAVLYLNLNKERFKGESSLETYTLSICKNIWLHKLRTLRHQENKLADLKLEQLYQTREVMVDFTRLTALLEHLGHDCQKILRLFYYEKQSMEEIMGHFGLSNKQSAKNKKARCMQRLTEIVKSANVKLSDFFDPE